MKPSVIKIRGARQHNLQSLDLDLPLNSLTVVSGVSGSGKSSLAFDTLYAEGQRRYVETFSPYARQFMDRMDRPRVDLIEAVPPAIAIDRKDPVRTSRSTVGTMAEITDYVKLLFARRGVLHCRNCGQPVAPTSAEAIWQEIGRRPAGGELIVTFPFELAQEGPERTARQLMRLGYDRLFQDGKIVNLSDWSPAPGGLRLDVVADRTQLDPADRSRIVDSLEQALGLGGGRLDLWLDRRVHLPFSNQLECPRCRKAYARPLPNLFSFNSPVGACETCRGFGRVIDIDPDLIIPDRRRSIAMGAIRPWGDAAGGRSEYRELLDFCRRSGIPTDRAFEDLPADQQRAVMEGTDGYYGVRGFFNWLESKTYRMHVRVFLSRYRSYDRCPDCRGTRFKAAALDYRLAGRTIADVYALNVDQALTFFQDLAPGPDEALRLIVEEIRGRLAYLRDVGLGYLTLDRQSRSLSGGEVQRVALAAALGASLVDTLYVLDEPSIGLHPRDTRRLVDTLVHLRDQGNTVVVVEHDPDIIGRSDYLLDLGPGAGEKGGRLVYFGPTAEVNGSLTGQYLSGARRIAVPARRRATREAVWLSVEGAAAHNLKQIDLTLPLQRFVCISGVSGSGKSTLVEKILYRAVKREKGDDQGRPGAYRRLVNAEAIDDVELVDQHPIGRTPRANALTFTKALEPVRRLLADTDAARRSGFGAGHFSFNTAGGRCEACRGEGFERVEMQFLSDVYITCPTCGGRRFGDEVLAVRYRRRNIADIFEMTVDEGLAFFDDQPRIIRALEPLARVGLGYLRLGQPINTLSGGEAQRLKLSRHLGRGGGRRLLIFDEPTTGLHLHDIRILLTALHALVDEGQSVVVVEHNPHVIKTADWVVDLGPEGGAEGGWVVAAGPPETVAACRQSRTGRFLAPLLTAGEPASGSPMAAEAQPAYGGANGRAIHITGAREHNLKNISLEIPRHQLVALTGVSGSGKSTLAFDILFAEGQRRYLESLAPYVRQYMKILERPEVDRLTGLPPTVAIEQRISHAGRRSTVATLTEVYHFLRLLFARLGHPHCPSCGQPLTALTRDAMVQQIGRHFGRQSARILAPKVANRKGMHKEVLARALKAGHEEAWIDGRIIKLASGMALDRFRLHTVAWVIGRLSAADPKALVDAALAEGGGALMVEDGQGGLQAFSLDGICPTCGVGVEAPGDPQRFSFNSPLGACARCEGLGVMGVAKNDRAAKVCPDCGGSRLNPRALAVKVDGRTIWDLVSKSSGDLRRLLAGLRIEPTRRPVADPILAEINGRLELLEQLGLGYLSLSRSGQTLSGGEAQRVRLAAQLGSNLTGVAYILDEPTIGLHPRDNHLLIDALQALRNRGNTVVVVEHDEDTIRAADTVIDLGPGAGDHGGEVVASGCLADIMAQPASPTGRLLAAAKRAVKTRGRPGKKGDRVKIRGASVNNLHRLTAEFPLGTMIAVSGVSGSGKSSLLKETLFRELRARLNGKPREGKVCEAVEGWQAVTAVCEVDHSPIGRTPRSVPATYVGIMDPLRRLFAATPAARTRGYGPGRFSFNLAGGRCEACQGQGHPKVEMSFLPDVYVPCEVCGGTRFNADTLAVVYKQRTIAEVLAMTFDEARDLFAAVPEIRRTAAFVSDIGLGYLRLGQPSPTLSGGEAQRIKLARHLARPGNGHTFFILDEPTTGLHAADVERLVGVLQRLVDAGNTVAAVEHNLDFIAAADWVIDLGPEGGDGGGRIVFAGPPEKLRAAWRRSHTGRFLKRHLGRAAA